MGAQQVAELFFMAEYPLTDEARKLIETRLKRHGPSGDSPARHGHVMEAAVVFAVALAKACPPSYELEEAMRRLQECQFWANAAIARHEQ